MAFNITYVSLVIVVFVVVRYWLLRALWKPVTEPDKNQQECDCKAKGHIHLSKTYAPSREYAVRAIKLTDDGEFADRCELSDAIYEIRNYRAPELIIWYIHGWLHNAEPGDSHLTEFGKLIRELNEQQRNLDEKHRRRVVGVYVGWDAAVGPAFLQRLTFWNRKRAADRISQSSVLTKIIAATKHARKQKGKEITSRDLTIMIGHSFGARILYTATCQVLINEVQRQHPGEVGVNYGLVEEGPADLILLLNPALEASVFTAMHSIRRPEWWETINKGQRPLLLAIASENDQALGWAFKWGQRLEFARRDRHRQYLALGHYEDYTTHRLQRMKSRGRKTFWYDDFEAAGLRLELLPKVDPDGKDITQPGNPFLVAQTTSDIINGHGEIWGKDLKNWLIGFLSELQKQAETKPLERN